MNLGGRLGIEDCLITCAEGVALSWEFSGDRFLPLCFGRLIVDGLALGLGDVGLARKSGLVQPFCG